jgi:hypothetical protein
MNTNSNTGAFNANARPSGHPRFDELTDLESETNQRKVTGLFLLVINSGAHKLKNGSTATKSAWIKLYTDAFNNTNRERFGVFGMHKTHSCTDYQNKLKTLVFRLANYFNELYEQRASTFVEDADDISFTDNERLGHQIIQESSAAEAARAHALEEERNTAREDRIRLENAEAYLGAVPPGMGVEAPHGVELNNDIMEGLGLLGKQTKSKTSELLLDF